VCQLEPRAEGVVGAVGDPEQLLFARYHDVVLHPWHVPTGIVYIGDAAHATSPQLGQGANLALCDAAALVDALDAADTLADALDRYSGERRSHLRYYQWATRMLTPFFQSDATPLGWLRDGFMGLACKLPWIRTKMLRTMCGLERGILAGAPLPMPALPSADLVRR
jgi:2-polyprenyl-6-methoxyphenol hydroxylase-like FAD-dependent oxidoreductase